LLIVTETNLIQRSFTDLKPSERAVALSIHYEAIKKTPSYRSDLIAEIEELSGAPVGPRMKTREKLGVQYGLGKTTITRYLQINKLIPAFKERLDKNKFGMHAAESLSFLNNDEQEMLEEYLSNGSKISIKQAEELKEKSQERGLTKTSTNEILEPSHVGTEVKPVKLSNKFLSKYFKPEQHPAEIENIISMALEQYFTNQDI